MSLSPASSMRQRVTYSIGDVPTDTLNQRAKVDSDMTARSPSACKVQRCAGALVNGSVRSLRPCAYRSRANSLVSRRRLPSLPRDAALSACSSIRWARCCAIMKARARLALAQLPASSARDTSASLPCPVPCGSYASDRRQWYPEQHAGRDQPGQCKMPADDQAIPAAVDRHDPANPGRSGQN